MPELTLTSPAKINLYLKVLGKRKDGYHNIETVMQKIDLCDTLILKERKKGIKIFCTDKRVPVDENNLCYQAADLLLKNFSLARGVEISIKKKIPVAAGLGGGSSNAASAFLGLNKLWDLRINEKELLKVGGEIGADVPFFISSFSTAKCKGKGDKISPFSFPPTPRSPTLQSYGDGALRRAGSQKVCYLLVVPNFSVSTKEVYDGLGFFATQPKPLSLLEINNDLEKIVIRKFPLIARIKQEFEKLGVKSAMSGSGPTVFGIFEEQGNEVQRSNCEARIAKQAKGVIEAEKNFRKFGRTYICMPR